MRIPLVNMIVSLAGLAAQSSDSSEAELSLTVVEQQVLRTLRKRAQFPMDEYKQYVRDEHAAGNEAIVAAFPELGDSELDRACELRDTFIAGLIDGTYPVPGSVAISDAKIVGSDGVIVQSTVIPMRVDLRRCQFRTKVYVEDCDFHRVVSFLDSSFSAGLSFMRNSCSQSLDLSGISVDGVTNFYGLVAERELFLIGARFRPGEESQRRVLFNTMRVDGGVHMSLVECEGALDLGGVRVGRDLKMQGLKCIGSNASIFLRQAQVDGQILLDEYSPDDEDLLRAHPEGLLVAHDESQTTRIDRELVLQDVRIGPGLVLNQLHANALSLVRVRVSGPVWVSGVDVHEMVHVRDSSADRLSILDSEIGRATQLSEQEAGLELENLQLGALSIQAIDAPRVAMEEISVSRELSIDALGNIDNIVVNRCQVESMAWRDAVVTPASHLDLLVNNVTLQYDPEDVLFRSVVQWYVDSAATPGSLLSLQAALRESGNIEAADNVYVAYRRATMGGHSTARRLWEWCNDRFWRFATQPWLAVAQMLVAVMVVSACGRWLFPVQVMDNPDGSELLPHRPRLYTLDLLLPVSLGYAEHRRIMDRHPYRDGLRVALIIGGWVMTGIVFAIVIRSSL